MGSYQSLITMFANMQSAAAKKSEGKQSVANHGPRKALATKAPSQKEVVNAEAVHVKNKPFTHVKFAPGSNISFMQMTLAAETNALSAEAEKIQNLEEKLKTMKSKYSKNREIFSDNKLQLEEALQEFQERQAEERKKKQAEIEEINRSIQQNQMRKEKLEKEVSENSTPLYRVKSEKEDKAKEPAMQDSAEASEASAGSPALKKRQADETLHVPRKKGKHGPKGPQTCRGCGLAKTVCNGCTRTILDGLRNNRTLNTKQIIGALSEATEEDRALKEYCKRVMNCQMFKDARAALKDELDEESSVPSTPRSHLSDDEGELGKHARAQRAAEDSSSD